MKFTNRLAAFLAVAALAATSVLFAADNQILPGNANSGQSGKAYLKDNAGHLWPAEVAYTTDGNGNVVPIGSSGVTLGTVAQGPRGTGASTASSWYVDIEQLLGAAPSVTNTFPARISNGTSFVDPTQIRALTLSDQVSCQLIAGSAAVGSVSVSSSALPTGAATSANQATANTSLSSIATNTGLGSTAAGQATAQTSFNSLVTNTGLAATAANQTNGLQTAAPVDGLKASYSAAAFAFAPVTGATDIFCISGSGTKTIRVTYAEFSLTKTTAAVIGIQLIKRSTADTGGTSVVETAVPHDSSDAAATASVLAYTANPTLGTTVGPIRGAEDLVGTTANSVQDLMWDFGMRPARAVVLRGTAQSLCMNLNGAALAADLVSASFEWTEE